MERQSVRGMGRRIERVRDWSMGIQKGEAHCGVGDSRRDE